MPWLDLSAVALIVGWACVFLVKRWRGRKVVGAAGSANGACGRCSNADCGSS